MSFPETGGSFSVGSEDFSDTGIVWYFLSDSLLRVLQNGVAQVSALLFNTPWTLSGFAADVA